MELQSFCIYGIATGQNGSPWKPSVLFMNVWEVVSGHTAESSSFPWWGDGPEARGHRGARHVASGSPASQSCPSGVTVRHLLCSPSLLASQLGARSLAIGQE